MEKREKMKKTLEGMKNADYPFTSNNLQNEKITTVCKENFANNCF